MEVIQIYNTKQKEYHMAFKKYKEKTKYLDFDSRAIMCKIAMNSVIKHAVAALIIMQLGVIK
jgi:hypothetical protein